jgi:hypothetical protein
VGFIVLLHGLAQSGVAGKDDEAGHVDGAQVQFELSFVGVVRKVLRAVGT